MSLEGPKRPEKKKTSLEDFAHGTMANAVRAATVAVSLGGGYEAGQAMKPTLENVITSRDTIGSVIEKTKQPEVLTQNDLEGIHYDTHFNMQERWKKLPQSTNIADHRKMNPVDGRFADAIIAQQNQRSPYVLVNLARYVWGCVRDYFKSDKS